MAKSDLKILLVDDHDIVLRLIASGKKTDDIAAQMGLSSNTIETHRRHLLAKLHARNSAELVLNAVKRGLLPTSRI